MPYVNIKESKTAGGIAVIIGKLQSQLSMKVMQNAADLSKSMRENGCPDRETFRRAMNKKDQIDKINQRISKQLQTFSRMAKTIQVPIKGLEAAIDVIKAIPIPQAVPPGFGIPISVTTKFADTLHLLKETVKQAKDIAEGIDTSLKTPLNQVNSIKTVSDRVNTLLQVCSLKLSIEDELNKASELEKENLLSALRQSGLYNEDNEFALSTPAKSLLDFGEDDTIAIIQTESGEKRITTNKTEGIPNATFITASETQFDLLHRIDIANSQLATSNLPEDAKNNIRDNLNSSYKSLVQQTKPINGRMPSAYYIGPNGIAYSLEIIEDPSIKYLVPKRYAVARDMSGVIVMKGAPSFSSSTDILIEEIKFRIDHQLP